MKSPGVTSLEFLQPELEHTQVNIMGTHFDVMGAIIRYTCICNVYCALFIDKSTFTDMYLVHFRNAHEIYLYDVMPRC